MNRLILCSNMIRPTKVTFRLQDEDTSKSLIKSFEDFVGLIIMIRKKDTHRLG